MNERLHGKSGGHNHRSRLCDVRRHAPRGMQAPQYGAEVPSEEQQGDRAERDKERGDLVLGLVVVGVPDFGAERMVGGRVTNEEVPHGYQHDEERSKERHESELRSRH
ncbi:hypothetical protein [Streptomyces sp. HUAS ZL42]|uniref:hypothetical protein n=1 Tax=Streptomyces sp. HUAS ZL42 TaxID=3231715 RepID=UPI00345E7C1D